MRDFAVLSPPLLSRMCLPVHIPDLIHTKVEIHLRRRNIGVSHHLLDTL